MPSPDPLPPEGRPRDPEPPSGDSLDLDLELLAPDEQAAAWSPTADAALAVACVGRPPSPPLSAVAADALLDMIGHGSTETNREVGGILLGDYCRDQAGPLTRVTDIIIADTAEASLTHVTFTHESWTQIHRQLDQRHDGSRIVGWYHTHPGFGPFLSAHDLFIQQNFFNDPRHLALVLDPVQNTFAVFGWREGAIVKAAGCYAFTPREQEGELRTLLARLAYAGDPEPRPRGWPGSRSRR